MRSTFQRLWTLLTTSQAIRQSAVMTVGTTITAVIMAVAMILASRELGPEKFGIFSVGVSLMGLLVVGTNLGLNQLIPRLVNRWHDQPEKLKEFVGSIIFLKIGLSLLLVVVAGASVSLITSLIKFPHPDIVWWTIIGAIGIGWYEHVYLMLSARHDFTGVNILNITQALIKSIGFMLILFVFKFGLDSIVVVYFLTPPAVAVFLGWLWKDKVWAYPRLGGPSIRQTILKFFGHTFVGIIAMVMISNVDVLLVQRALTPFDTGVYAGAGRVAMFIGFVTASVGGVLNNRVARYHDKEVLKKYLLKSLSIVGLALLGFICFLPFANLAIIFTVGPEYVSGTTALIILVLNAFLCLAIVPYTAFFYAVDHPAYFSVGGALQVAIILLGNIFFLEKYGLDAAAWSRTLATVAFGLYTAVYTWYAWKNIAKKQ